jgi:hypothetical protein
MLTTIIIFSTVLLLFTLLHFAEIKKQQGKCERKLYGVNILQHVLGLLSNVQQHRGICAALLSGDQAFSPRRSAKHSEIQEIFKYLLPLLADRSELHADKQSLLAIEHEWNQLSKSIHQLNPEQSFKQHTTLIRKVIHLLGDIGEHIGLMDGEGSPLALLSNTLLLKLPLLMESIGQARALGTGYAAKGECGAVGRIRLSFLVQHIQACQKDIIAVSQNISANQQVHALLKTLNERFIDANEVDIAPDIFFRTATDAIEACLYLWKDFAQKTNDIVEAKT